MIFFFNLWTPFQVRFKIMYSFICLEKKMRKRKRPHISFSMRNELFFGCGQAFWKLSLEMFSDCAFAFFTPDFSFDIRPCCYMGI